MTVQKTFVRAQLGLLATLGFLAFAAPPAAAQVDVRGQILLPDGNLPSNPLRFYLASDDGRVNEYRYTDSNGRFILERLNNRISYTMTVDSDGQSFATTRYTFVPAYESVVRLTLNDLPHKAVPASSTVSAASGYKPVPKAAALYDRGMKEIDKKRNDSAERLLRQAIEADPKFMAPLNDLGVVLMQKRNYSEAEHVLRRALAADPKSVHALLNLSITLNHQGKYDEAVAPLREALRLEPGLVAAHLHLGMALVETDQLQEAEKELFRASKSANVDQTLAQLYLGKLYARTGDFDKSIAAFNSYLEAVPEASNVGDVRALIARMKELKAMRQ